MGSGHVPQRIEEPTTNRPVAGWNPAVPATLISPASGVNRLRGLASGRSQRQGFYTHCHFGNSARRKQGGNDLPQLPFSDGKSRVLWGEKGSALEVPAVPKAFL